LASKDERAVQLAAQHRDIRTTRRYTEASVEPRIAAAFAAMSRGDDFMGRPDGSARQKSAQNGSVRGRRTPLKKGPRS